MTGFLHELAQGLRGREQMLEGHAHHPIFDTKQGVPLRTEYDGLVKDVRAFSAKVTKAQNKGKDYDEHFEHEIKGDHEKLVVKIDAWSKKLS